MVNRLVACSLALGAAAGTVAAVRGSDSGTDSPAVPTLRQAAGDRVLIGAALMAAHVQDPAHARLIAEQFNCLTPGNEMKPDHLQHLRGQFTFERADRIVAFAQAHGQRVIGHTLCWHEQSPKWLFEDEDGLPLPREVALTNLKEHIHTVVNHFKGKVKGWDVVNEAINDGPEHYLRDTPARRAIGDDYVLKAFQFAHEADPDVELYYNDYNIERDYKRDRALRLVREIRAAGLRIDGVGIQGHWLLESPDLEEIARGVRTFIDDDFKVMITELDVDPLPRPNGGAGADLRATDTSGLDPYKNGLPHDVQRKLADRYAALVTMLLKHPQVTRITLWGTTDGNTWLNDWPVKARTNHPLLWDREMRSKPARDTVIRALQAARPAAQCEVSGASARGQVD